MALLQDGSSITVYTAAAADTGPTCAALNTYTLPPAAVASGKAGVVVVGVRVVPSQKRVASKMQLMHVSGETRNMHICRHYMVEVWWPNNQAAKADVQ